MTSSLRLFSKRRPTVCGCVPNGPEMGHSLLPPFSTLQVGKRDFSSRFEEASSLLESGASLPHFGQWGYLIASRTSDAAASDQNMYILLITSRRGERDGCIRRPRDKRRMRQEEKGSCVNLLHTFHTSFPSSSSFAGRRGGRVRRSFINKQVKRNITLTPTKNREKKKRENLIFSPSGTAGEGEEKNHSGHWCRNRRTKKRGREKKVPDGQGPLQKLGINHNG